MGADPDEISSEECTGSICPSVFENAHQMDFQLNIDNIAAVEKFLLDRYGELPIEKSPAVARQIFNQNPFVCPEIDVEIRQPCQVKSCAYWTDHAWTRNCILFYRVDQHRDSLDTKDLTFLLGSSSSEIRKKTNRAITELRRWALHHKTTQQEDAEAPMAPQDDGCVVCGEIIPKPILKNGFHYCSPKCFETKPPVDFRIEQEFQLPVGRVLEICIDSFASRRPICHALSVTTKQLTQLCGRYAVDLSRLD